MILIVAAAAGNRQVLHRVLVDAGLSVSAVKDEAQAEEAVGLKTGDIRVAVIDLAGLSPRVWSLCRTFSAQKVACVVILPRENREALAQALACGARAVLVKPLVMREFLPLILGLAGTP